MGAGGGGGLGGIHQKETFGWEQGILIKPLLEQLELIKASDSVCVGLITLLEQKWDLFGNFFVGGVGFMRLFFAAVRGIDQTSCWKERGWSEGVSLKKNFC